MSIRIHQYSESMGGADVVENMMHWSLENPPRPADKDFMKNMPWGTTVLDRTQYQMIHSEKLRASFINDESLGYGRNESQHQVRFGQMILNSAMDHESPDLVAVKPFNFAKDLHHEWAANTYLNSVGHYQQAFLPLGIWKSTDGDYNLITLYEHGVKSYDEVFWADINASPEALRPQVIDKAVRVCLMGLGYLHGLGMVHGDAQAKNLAKDNRRIRFIDLESASLLPRIDKEIVEGPESDRLTARDIDSFFTSTMLVPENLDRVAEVIKEPMAAIDYHRSYRDGLRRGSSESRLVVPALMANSAGYFEAVLADL